MFKKVIRWFSDMLSMKPVSVDAAGSQACSKKKAGFTIVELMVVIIIVNLLSGVAVPKCTDLIEKTREKVDLLKFYYLRDALNRALYEDDAFRIDTTAQCGTTKNSQSKLSQWLASEKGVSLFIIELHDKYPANYQGENKGRTSDDQNMCGLLSSEGFWSQALRDAGFGAVADIVIARADNNQFSKHPGDYVTETASNGWVRSYPKTPIFKSKVLNGDPNAKAGNNGQNRYSMKIRWTGGDPNSHSLEVFLAKDGTTRPLISRFGTCFSTQAIGCR